MRKYLLGTLKFQPEIPVYALHVIFKKILKTILVFKIKIKFKIKNKTKTIPVYALHVILCINNFVPVQTQKEIFFTESPILYS